MTIQTNLVYYKKLFMLEIILEVNFIQDIFLQLLTKLILINFLIKILLFHFVESYQSVVITTSLRWNVYYIRFAKKIEYTLTQ